MTHDTITSADESFTQSHRAAIRMKLALENTREGVHLISRANWLLAVDARRPEGPNIGLNGEHLSRPAIRLGS